MRRATAATPACASTRRRTASTSDVSSAGWRNRLSSPAARKLPGRVRYGNAVLRRGISGRTELFEWWKAVRDGDIHRRNVVVTLHDEQQQPVQRWVLRNAWPTKYDASDLNAKGNEVMVETLELALEGIELD
ncbi:phage tail protein [uncultured Arthrobacter sp.]|uniref:phage tail protein n=1 Tax=uncultured Arthrobacter sp. TaxID=114050 RepID=UPI003217888A